MLDTRQYSQPVHRSLLQRDLLGGVPSVGLLLLLILGLVFIYGLELYISIVPLVILYIIMRALTQRDPWLIDILLENIQQRDRLLP
jgi:type IV secretory pathway TrbD component